MQRTDSTIRRREAPAGRTAGDDYGDCGDDGVATTQSQPVGAMFKPNPRTLASQILSVWVGLATLAACVSPIGLDDDQSKRIEADHLLAGLWEAEIGGSAGVLGVCVLRVSPSEKIDDGQSWQTQLLCDRYNSFNSLDGSRFDPASEALHPKLFIKDSDLDGLEREGFIQFEVEDDFVSDVVHRGDTIELRGEIWDEVYELALRRPGEDALRTRLISEAITGELGRFAFSELSWCGVVKGSRRWSGVANGTRCRAHFSRHGYDRWEPVWSMETNCGGAITAESRIVRRGVNKSSGSVFAVRLAELGHIVDAHLGDEPVDERSAELSRIDVTVRSGPRGNFAYHIDLRPNACSTTSVSDES